MKKKQKKTKKKNRKIQKLSPSGSKFLPFRVGPFKKGIDLQESKQNDTKFVSLLEMTENLPSVSNRARNVETTSIQH